MTQTNQKNLLSPCKLITLSVCDLFPHLEDLLIVLIVVKSIDSSMSVHIRIS